jgi:AcrR family transcriptional regulator
MSDSLASSPLPARRRAAASGAPYHHGALHAALLAAAQGILESQGLEALTLRGAARAAGVSHAAPKNHFGDLTGLRSELAALGFQQFAEALRNAPSFDAAGMAYVSFAREHPAMFLLMFRGERLDLGRPALSKAVGEVRQALADAAAASLGLDAGAAGEAPLPGAQLVRMVAAWSQVHGFAMLLIDGRLKTLLRQWPGDGDWRGLLAAVFEMRNC